jgi:adenosine/AMP kinase
VDTKLIDIPVPEGANVIAGQSHFIKTVEDLYEIFTTGVPGIKFGIAFCEASQERLIRWDGNDKELTDAAIAAANAVGSGHFFIAFIRDAFPINVLPAIKACPEVCRIFCATANPVKMVVGEEGDQRAVLGVMDGNVPLGVEGEEHQKVRKDFLRKINYKVG